MKLLTLLFCFFISFAAFPQPSALSTKSKKAIELYTEADNYRVRGQYSYAINLLQQALDKDKKFVEAWYRMGIIYMSLKKFPEAIKNFETGLNLTTDIRKQKVFWFDMGEAWFALGDYDKAGQYIGDFLKAETTNRQRIERARLLNRNIEFAKNNAKASAGYKQRVMSDTVNRFVMQYFPVLTADEAVLIFTRRTGFTDEFDEDLVVSSRDEKGQWAAPKSISSTINTSGNEGTCTVSADGRKLIFTSCAGRDGFGSCDLFESRRIGDEWTEPVNLGPNINTAEWESQPSLSADGRTLYFVSDRRGGLGRRDIWVSSLLQNGEWSRARNIGKPVNTAYDEYSPFIHVNSQYLFFASNGRTGYGGYDLYVSRRDSTGWGEPENVGPPVNNHEDQFSLFITADGKKGYYAHEELASSGHAVSKLMEMEIPADDRIALKSNYVKGIVRDRETRLPLRAKIEMINIATEETESMVESDSVTGQYLIVLNEGAEYALYVNRKNYLFRSLHFNYSEATDSKPITVDIELERVKEGSVAILENIFFDFDKYELKEKSMTELRKVERFLIENPAVRVEIGGHTDNRGTVEYNMQLSQRRARSVYNYLIDRGISAERLVSRGYGPARPIASNDTEEGQQQNRRIEFKLIR